VIHVRQKLAVGCWSFLLTPHWDASHQPIGRLHAGLGRVLDTVGLSPKAETAQQSVVVTVAMIASTIVGTTPGVALGREAHFRTEPPRRFSKTEFRS
tara:strand:+ start:1059 stop:1349 length:291 start_codon:yes stop_codon:yes gene_type:complete